MTSQYFLQKSLTANDVGATGSHQAGIHVPHAFADFFPRLQEGTLNPDAWLDVADSHGGTYTWRWIHYNNRVVGSGTRDEYRLTHTARYLQNAGAREGDLLELEAIGPRSYQALVRSRPRAGILVLSTAGAWRTITVKK